MTHYHDAATAELEFERLRFEQRRYAERMSSNQATVPAIKMIIGDWYLDELLVMAVIGAAYFAISGVRFRRTLVALQ